MRVPETFCQEATIRLIMNNYHYIIAGLPYLIPDSGTERFSFGTIRSSVKEQLSDRDRRLVDWLEAGSNTDNLCGHFYRAVARQKSGFLRNYFEMDRKLRNAATVFIAAKTGTDPSKYTVGETESSMESYPELQEIFQCSDLFEREHRLDRLRWDKITEMTVFHYFDMDVILAFLAKGMIVERWQAMDKERGAVLFRQYVDEVRGTFKGIDFK